MMKQPTNSDTLFRALVTCDKNLYQSVQNLMLHSMILREGEREGGCAWEKREFLALHVHDAVVSTVTLTHFAIGRVCVCVRAHCNRPAAGPWWAWGVRSTQLTRLPACSGCPGPVGRVLPTVGLCLLWAGWIACQ